MNPSREETGYTVVVLGRHMMLGKPKIARITDTAT